MSKIIILHSGGLDSTVCLAMGLKNGHEVVSLGIDYGQRHRLELEYAKSQCKRFGVERHVIKLEWDKPAREIPKNRSIAEIKSGVSTAFLPGRNIVFFSIACAEAAGIGATEIWTGVNAIDFSGYPDCRPDFIESYSNMLSLGIPGGPKLISPILHKTKSEIAGIAKDLGIHKGDTWSCYSPQFHAGGVSPCGSCDACILHNEAWHSMEQHK